jgi:UDP-N-acetylmuramate dehydrogenase
MLILGGGSNLLFAADPPGPVVHPAMDFVHFTPAGKTEVWVEAGAGMEWDKLVQLCLQEQAYGLENLSLIPGSVGAAPVQNIGAYGIELESVFHSLKAFDTKEGIWREFNKEECAFSYRDSLFKQERNRFLITLVRLRLSRTPQVHIAYGGIRDELERLGVAHPSPVDIRQAVVNIRTAKLPDPAEYGNAGSFFKNPLVSSGMYTRLREQYPTIPAYPQASGEVKLAAGWLIDQCGLKGFRMGNAGVHSQQALVLVNLGGARADEVLALARYVRDKVMAKFGVLLEPEVNIIGDIL